MTYDVSPVVGNVPVIALSPIFKRFVPALSGRPWLSCIPTPCAASLADVSVEMMPLSAPITPLTEEKETVQGFGVKDPETMREVFSDHTFPPVGLFPGAFVQLVNTMLEGTHGLAEPLR
ncbi:hypothetical protein AX755_03910 [Enterobacter sp. SENG-6]|nr:hypothetical protein AX755_03910 [Enterobacter sp. SENG-6]